VYYGWTGLGERGGGADVSHNLPQGSPSNGLLRKVPTKGKVASSSSHLLPFISAIWAEKVFHLLNKLEASRFLGKKGPPRGIREKEKSLRDARSACLRDRSFLVCKKGRRNKNATVATRNLGVGRVKRTGSYTAKWAIVGEGGMREKMTLENGN